MKRRRKNSRFQRLRGQGMSMAARTYGSAASKCKDCTAWNNGCCVFGKARRTGPNCYSAALGMLEYTLLTEERSGNRGKVD